jgi:hypothetical protein
MAVSLAASRVRRGDVQGALVLLTRQAQQPQPDEELDRVFREWPDLMWRLACDEVQR